MSKDLPDNIIVEEEKFPTNDENNQSAKPAILAEKSNILESKIDIDTKNKKFVSMDTFKCPIKQEIFINPVIASDGHTYEEEAIRKLQKRGRKSPMTRERFTSNRLIPNLLLKTIMQEDPVLNALMKKNKHYFFVQNDQKVFAKAVLDFVDTMKTELKKTPVPKAIGTSWDANASTTFVATLIRAIRYPETAQQLIDNPIEAGIPKELMAFIIDYVNTHPDLKKAAYYPDQCRAISRLLYEGKIKKIKEQCTDIKKTDAVNHANQIDAEEKYTIDVPQNPKEEDVTDIASLPPHPLVMDTLIDPITLETFVCPVTTIDGHTYEKETITKWLKEHNTSPFTNKELPSTQLVHNYAISSIVKDKNAPDKIIAEKQRFFVEQGIEQAFSRAVVKFVEDMQLYLDSCSVPKNYGATQWDDNAALTFVATTIKRLRNPETYQRLLENPEESSIPEKVIDFIKTYVNNHPILLKAQTSKTLGQLAYDINVKLLKGKLDDIREIYAGLPRQTKSKNDCVIL